jgi:hypothetical protein
MKDHNEIGQAIRPGVDHGPGGRSGRAGAHRCRYRFRQPAARLRHLRPRDYNAWLGKITCNRLGGIDADADTSAAFLSKNFPRGSTIAQTWQFLAGAIGTYCPDQTPGPDVGCATALMGVHPGCDAKPARR